MEERRKQLPFRQVSRGAEDDDDGGVGDPHVSLSGLVDVFGGNSYLCRSHDSETSVLSLRFWSVYGFLRTELPDGQFLGHCFGLAHDPPPDRAHFLSHFPPVQLRSCGLSTRLFALATTLSTLKPSFSIAIGPGEEAPKRSSPSTSP